MPDHQKTIPRPPGIISEKLNASDIVKLTNEYRISLGLPPLRENFQLTHAAEYRANDMIKNSYYAHVNPVTGENPGDAITQANYQFRTYAENIAMGNFQSNRHIVDGWINSPGHRANIVNPDIREIGVAIIKDNLTPLGRPSVYYGVQLFASPMPDCSRPSNADKALLQDMQRRNDDIWKRVDDKRREIENLKSRIDRETNTATRNRLIPDYNRQVGAFNSLAAEAKGMQESLKLVVQAYNKKVNEYNACMQTDSFVFK
ncbi:CAP domain-containing protein [Desulfonatronum thioautotrophicum]|uniref:CAP domain-containing protein n=1 Tax=Desulfonatronum thioautotrophicum TaxID=617001 RepID=UPI00137936BA|nr:CAP domain-containing protein [Desulfonatronum thioautotrophicum]